MQTLLSTVADVTPGQLDVSPEKLADGLATNPLAWGCVILLVAVTFLGRALMASYEARLALMQSMYEQLLATHTETVTLSLKYTEGLDVLDKAIDRFTPES